MKANQAAHSIATMCRVLGVSAERVLCVAAARRERAGAGRTRSCSTQIRAFHRRSRGTYGAPRIHRDLRAAGVRVGRKRVARLLKQAGLQGVSRRKWPVTTVRAEHARPAPDLVQRAFTATAPNQLWVADITYIPTWGGHAVSGGRPRRLESPDHRLGDGDASAHELVRRRARDGDRAAAARRRSFIIRIRAASTPRIEFGRRCREAHVRPSMGSVGDCYDNAMCESFFATLECELLDRVTLRTPAEARTAVFDFIEGWYNPTRRHSALDYLSPIDFERQAAPPAV